MVRTWYDSRNSLDQRNRFIQAVSSLKFPPRRPNPRVQLHQSLLRNPYKFWLLQDDRPCDTDLQFYAREATLTMQVVENGRLSYIGNAGPSRCPCSLTWLVPWTEIDGASTRIQRVRPPSSRMKDRAVGVPHSSASGGSSQRYP